MSWLAQFHFIMRTSLTSLRERVENPERMLHQAILDLEDELARVRQSVAAAIADEIQLSRKVERTQGDSHAWRERATAALRRADERAAEQALEQKGLCDERLADLEREHATQREQTVELTRSVHDMEDRLRQARQKQTLLLARLARAESRTQITLALDHAEGGNALAQLARIEERVERAEALSSAHAQLSDRHLAGEHLEREFADAARRQQAARELAVLKQQLAGEGASP